MAAQLQVIASFFSSSLTLAWLKWRVHQINAGLQNVEVLEWESPKKDLCLSWTTYCWSESKTMGMAEFFLPFSMINTQNVKQHVACRATAQPASFIFIIKDLVDICSIYSLWDVLPASTKAVAICNNADMLYFMENRSLCHVTLYTSVFKCQIFLLFNPSLMFPKDWLRVVWYHNLLYVSWRLLIKWLMAIYNKSQSFWGLNAIFCAKYSLLKFIFGINPSIFISFLFCKSVTIVEGGLLSASRIIIYAIVSFEWSQ